MTDFDDLLLECLPYALTEQIKGTAGRTWGWGYRIETPSGAAADLSGCTFAGTIASSSTRAAVASIDTFYADGNLWCEVSAAVTATIPPGRYVHEVRITRTSDSRVIDLVGGGDSHFTVLRKVA